jgi:hypothetical protein
MNCKAGDVAMYIGMSHKWLGSIVKVLRAPTLEEYRKISPDGVGGHWWVVDPPLDKNYLVADKALRPIKDPGDEERDNAWDFLPKVNHENNESR